MQFQGTTQRYTLFRVRGIYHLRWHFRGENPVQRTTRERQFPAAQEQAARIFAEAEAAWKGRRPMITLGELVQSWLAVHAGMRSRHHLRSVEKFARQAPDLAPLPLNRLNTAVVEQALARFRVDHNLTTCAHWLRVLNLLLHWAIKRKHLDAMPYQLPLPKLQRKPKLILPREKVKAWLEAVDQATGGNPCGLSLTERLRRGEGHMGLAVRLMLGLGLRREEALRARWEWYRPEEGTYTPGLTKGKEADPMKVPRWLGAILDPIAKPAGLMMPGRQGRPHHAKVLRRAMQLANQACDTPGITPHRLRATFATYLAAKVSLREAQRRLRHKDPRTTLGYVEEDQSVIERAQEAVFAEMGLAG